MLNGIDHLLDYMLVRSELSNVKKSLTGLVLRLDGDTKEEVEEILEEINKVLN